MRPRCPGLRRFPLMCSFGQLAQVALDDRCYEVLQSEQPRVPVHGQFLHLVLDLLRCLSTLAFPRFCRQKVLPLTFLTNDKTGFRVCPASAVFLSGGNPGRVKRWSGKGAHGMKLKIDEAWKRPLAVFAICFVIAGQVVWAQNLGGQPQTNVAVQGQTGAQPEGAFLNFINWIGNVIAPVGAGGAVVGAVVSWLHGRGVGRWLAAAAGLLAVSGITRLIEFWISSGTGGVT